MELALLGSRIEMDETFVRASTADIRSQVREYERGDRRQFTLDTKIPGGLLGEVMESMTEIPYGETRSYGALATDLDTAPIAIGGACARNPVPVIVPCHRVVRSDGSLGGYSAADGVSTKRRLLDFEARTDESYVVQTSLPNVR